MSDQAPAVPLTEKGALLALIERGEMVTGLTAKQLRAVEAQIAKALAESEAVLALLRAACGPELHGVAAHLGTMIGMGTGYFRHARDVIRAGRKPKGRKR